jgi:hypothetical protein
LLNVYKRQPWWPGIGGPSADTEQVLTAPDVKLVAIAAAGKLSEARQAFERSRRFKHGYRWRASRAEVRV